MSKINANSYAMRSNLPFPSLLRRGFPRSFHIKSIIIIVFAILLIYGCGGDDSQPPIIFSVAAEPKIVAPGESSKITVEAGDPDKDKISYTWSASGGRIDGTGKAVTWVSPEAEGKYDLTVTVSDGSGTAEGSITLRVWKPRPGDYYPLEVGNKWTFVDKNSNTIVFEIIDTIDISGTKAFVKQTTTSGLEGAVNFSYVSRDAKGINQHALGGASAGDDTIIFSPPLPLYKFPLIPEESWETEFDVKVPDGFFVGSGKAIYEVISEEDITVEAGTFHNVFQTREDFVWEILGQELDRTISRQWLAPDVGMVKFINQQTRGGETITTEATLQSYSFQAFFSKESLSKEN